MTRTSGTLRAPARAYALTLVVGLAVAAVVGASAGWSGVGDGGWWLNFGVFAAVAVVPGLSLGWVLFVSPHTVVPAPHAEDDVESLWFAQAMSGAFTDLVTAAGILLTVIAVGRIELDATPVLLVGLVLAFADTAVRYAVLRRRGR